MTLAQPVEEWLGAIVESSGGGASVLRMTVTRSHINGAGVIHGGTLFALADAALAHAAIIPEIGATVSGQISFIAPAEPGDDLVATARTSRRWGVNSIVDVTIETRDRVIAEFRGHARSALR